MRELTYMTVSRRVDLRFDALEGVRVLVDGEFLASYSLETVWDMMKSTLANLEPGDNIGLDRRRFEALAAIDSTQKWVEAQNDTPT